MGWDTVANVVSDAALQLGLVTAPIADPYGETDQDIVHLCALLKKVGEDLLRDYAWSQLDQEATFSTVIGTESYPLQADHQHFVEGTAWNRTLGRELLGPIGPRKWQQLKANAAVAALDRTFRIWRDSFFLHPVPDAVETIAYEYVSFWWVAIGAATPSKPAPTLPDDVLWLDRALLVDALRMYFLNAKGFDSAAATQDFNKNLERARSGDRAHPVLSRVQVAEEKLLDMGNLPDGFWG